MPDEATRKRIVEDYCRYMNDGDLDAVVELFADNVRFEDPMGSEPVIGRDALRHHLAQAIDGHVVEKPEPPVAAMDGRHVALTATITLSSPDAPPGTRIRFRLASILAIGPDELIHEVQVLWGRSDVRLVGADESITWTRRDVTSCRTPER